MKGILFSLFLILASLPFLSAQKESSDSLKYFEHDSIERTYLLHIPEEVSENPPLIVVLHGYTSSAETIMKYTKFNEIADREGFAVVYPQGSIDQRGNTFWNVAYDFHLQSKIDDLDFLIDLASFIVEEHNLSKENIFLTGMSNGGDMTYLQACKNPDFFSAFAPIAGTMMLNAFEKCGESSPPPILAVVGTGDEVTRFAGDINNEDQWGAYQSIPFIVDYWTKRLAYNRKENSELPDMDKKDGTRVMKTIYENEDSKIRFEYFEVVNGGHDWPGAYGNMDLITSEVVWDFFKSYIK